ncbi:hypothetical protein [Streptomyces sp. NPDC000851]
MSTVSERAAAGAVDEWFGPAPLRPSECTALLPDVRVVTGVPGSGPALQQF